MTHILAHLGLISVLHFTGVQERESTVIVNESPVAFYCRRGNWLLLLQVTDWGEVEPPQPTFGKIFSFEFCFSSVFFRFLVTFFSDFKKGTIQVRAFQTVLYYILLQYSRTICILNKFLRIKIVTLVTM